MAKEYEVDDLQHCFAESLMDGINLKNVVPYWLKASNLKNTALMNACATFISENFEEFKPSEEFSALIADDKKSAIMLMVDVVTVDGDNTTKKQLQDLIQNSEE